MAKDGIQRAAILETERADSEEAAKVQAQIDAQAQKRRADLEEKARIQGLAVTNPMIQAIVSGKSKFYFEKDIVFNPKNEMVKYIVVLLCMGLIGMVIG